MLFSLRKGDTLPNLIFENTQVNFVEYHKRLGVNLSTTGQWTTHVDNILASAS